MKFLRSIEMLLSKSGAIRRRHGGSKNVPPISNNCRFEALEGRRMLAFGEVACLLAANDVSENVGFTSIQEIPSEVTNAATGNDDFRATVLKGGTQPRGKKATFSISDAVISEPDSGTVEITFTVFRSGNTSGISSVEYYTVDDSATADLSNPALGDYVAKGGTLVFGEGVTEIDVPVLVNADEFDNEGTEEFFLTLANADNATIKRDQGVGFIQDTAADATSMYVESIRVVETKPSQEGSKSNYSFEIKVVDDLGNPVSGVGVIVKLSDPEIPENDHDHIIQQWPGDTNGSGIMTVSAGNGGRFGIDPGKVYNVEVIALSHFLYTWEQNGFLDGDDDDIFPENFFRAGDNSTYDDIPDINHIEL